MKLPHFFPAFHRNAPVELKLFEISLITTLFVMYIGLLVAFLSGYQPQLIGILTVGTVFYTAFYFQYLKKSATRGMQIVYYLGIFLLLAIAWLPTGGLMGSIHQVFVLFFISGLLVLSLKDFRKFIALSLIIIGGFVIFELLNPGAAPRFEDYYVWMIDTAVWQTIMVIVLAFVLYFYKKEYEKDRQKLNEVNLQLEKEKQKAEAGEQLKEKFLASISHEIRTPLNGIIGNLDLLQRENLTEEQRNLLRDMGHSSDILNGLISDLLDVAMIDEEGVVIQENEFDLKMLIQNIVQFFIPKVALKKGNVSISFEYDETIPERLLGDVTRIRQVLMNLMNNAVKFTHSGFVKISVALESIESGQVWLKFEVKDSGVGIPTDHQHSIFDVFQRSSNIAHEGMGLGLSICRKILNAMGGHIELQDSSGRGTIIVFRLPVKTAAQIHSSIASNPYSDLKILVAEDQKINQLVIRKMLKNLGVNQIDLAEDGQKTVEMALVKSYDFILMDIRMPEKDGILATKEILEMVKYRRPIIIAVTANASIKDQEACMDAGMRYFISKPFNLDVLRGAFDKFLVNS